MLSEKRRIFMDQHRSENRGPSNHGDDKTVPNRCTLQDAWSVADLIALLNALPRASETYSLPDAVAFRVRAGSVGRGLRCLAPPPHQAQPREANAEKGEGAWLRHGREVEEADRSDIVES